MNIQNAWLYPLQYRTVILDIGVQPVISAVWYTHLSAAALDTILSLTQLSKPIVSLSSFSTSLLIFLPQVTLGFPERVICVLPPYSTLPISEAPEGGQPTPKAWPGESGTAERMDAQGFWVDTGVSLWRCWVLIRESLAPKWFKWVPSTSWLKQCAFEFCGFCKFPSRKGGWGSVTSWLSTQDTCTPMFTAALIKIVKT